MAPLNTLLFSAGRRLELLRAFRRAYRELGVPGGVAACDADPLAPALQEADRAYVIPRLDDPRCLEAALEVCRREGGPLVFPLIDPDVLFLAKHRALLERAGARVAVLSEANARVVSDKWETHRLFARLGLPTPWTRLPGTATRSRLDYPVFVKPRFGSAGQGSMAARDRSELDFHLARTDRPLVCELLPGPEITCDVACGWRGEPLAVSQRRRIEARWGEVHKGVTVRDPAIERWCLRVARTLRPRGPITVQCILKGGKPRFTEINGRFAGGSPLSIAAGADLPLWLLARAAGRRVRVPPVGTYRLGLHLTRYDEAFYVEEEALGRLARGRL